MKVYKHNFIWAIILCTSVVFGQKQTKKINESFVVNKDVLVEIDTRHSDVTVETWNKNVVTISGVWEVEGMTKKEATDYFEGWDFEALGNKNKVVITSKSSNNFYEHSDVFDDIDFDFIDFESTISHVGELFNGDFYTALLPLNAMPPLPPMQDMPPVPLFPNVVIKDLSHVKFDHKAYQKDKKAYMKKFEKQQEDWQKEFEAKIEPQMKAYEAKLKQWEKENEPKMKVYEEKMKQWEKENGPKMKEFEEKMEIWGEEFGEKFGKSMEVWGEEFGKSMEEWGENFGRSFEMNEGKIAQMEMKLKKMEKEMGEKYAEKISEKFKIKKSFIIKVPKGATLKIDARYGEITLPSGIKTID